MNPKIAEIAKKFYKTEEERLAKTNRDQPIIEAFLVNNRDYLMELYNRGIMLLVFNVEGNTANVGMFPCCGEKVDIFRTDRMLASIKLKDAGLTNLIWEDLL